MAQTCPNYRSKWPTFLKALLFIGLGFLPSRAFGILGAPAGNFIQNTNSLQNGATFFVTSGTVQGQFVVNGGTAIFRSTMTLSGGRPVSITLPSSGQVLKYNSASGYWEPGSDNSGGGTTFAVQLNDANVDVAVSTIDFASADFNVTSSPAGEANISILATNSKFIWNSNALQAGSTFYVSSGTVEGFLTVDSSYTGTGVYPIRFQSRAPPAVGRLLPIQFNFPNSVSALSSFAVIEAQTREVTAGSVNGKLVFKIASDSVDKSMLELASESTGDQVAFPTAARVYFGTNLTTGAYIQSNGNDFIVSPGSNTGTRFLTIGDGNGNVTAYVLKFDGAVNDSSVTWTSSTNQFDTPNRWVFGSTMSLSGGRIVSMTAPSDGQALVWSAANSRWEPGTIIGGGGGVTVFPASSTILADKGIRSSTLTITSFVQGQIAFADASKNIIGDPNFIWDDASNSFQVGGDTLDATAFVAGVFDIYDSNADQAVGIGVPYGGIQFNPGQTTTQNVRIFGSSGETLMFFYPFGNAVTVGDASDLGATLNILAVDALDNSVLIREITAQSGRLLTMQAVGTNQIFGFRKDGGSGNGIFELGSTSQGVYQSATAAGIWTLAAYGGVQNEAIQMDLETTANVAKLTSNTSVSLFDVAMGLRADYLDLGDDERVQMGLTQDAVFEFDTGETNDTFKLGVALPGNSSGSGTFMIMQDGDVNTNFGVGISTYPKLRLQSPDQTSTGDFWTIGHDGTNANMEVGTGNLTLELDGYEFVLKSGVSGIRWPDGTLQVSSPTAGGGGVDPDDVVLNSNSLQSGATFYVSSGTVQGQFIVRQATGTDGGVIHRNTLTFGSTFYPSFFGINKNNEQYVYFNGNPGANVNTLFLYASTAPWNENLSLIDQGFGSFAVSRAASDRYISLTPGGNIAWSVVNSNIDMNENYLIFRGTDTLFDFGYSVQGWAHLNDDDPFLLQGGLLIDVVDASHEHTNKIIFGDEEAGVARRHAEIQGDATTSLDKGLIILVSTRAAAGDDTGQVPAERMYFEDNCAGDCEAVVLDNLALSKERNEGSMRWYDSDKSHYSAIKASETVTSSMTVVLPAAPGAVNELLAITSVNGTRVDIGFSSDITVSTLTVTSSATLAGLLGINGPIYSANFGANAYASVLGLSTVTFPMLYYANQSHGNKVTLQEFRIKDINYAVTGAAGTGSGMAYIPEAGLILSIDNNNTNIDVFEEDDLATEWGNWDLDNFSDPEAVDYVSTIYDSSGQAKSYVLLITEESCSAAQGCGAGEQRFAFCIANATATTQDIDRNGPNCQLINYRNAWTNDTTLGQEAAFWDPFLGGVWSFKQDTAFEARFVPMDGSTNPVAVEPWDAETLWGASFPAINDCKMDLTSRTGICIGDATGADNNNQDIWRFDLRTGAILENWQSYTDTVGLNLVNDWPQGEGIAFTPDMKYMFLGSETDNIARLERVRPAAYYHEMWINPPDIELSTFVPPVFISTASSGTGFPTRVAVQFDPTTDEVCYINFLMPQDFRVSDLPLLLDVYWYANDTTANADAIWAAQISATSEADADSMFEDAATAANTIAENVNITERGRLIVSQITLTTNDSIAAGDYATIVFFRDADDSVGNADNDGLAVEANVIGWRLRIPRY